MIGQDLISASPMHETEALVPVSLAMGRGFVRLKLGRGVADSIAAVLLQLGLFYHNLGALKCAF